MAIGDAQVMANAHEPCTCGHSKGSHGGSGCLSECRYYAGCDCLAFRSAEKSDWRAELRRSQGGEGGF